MPYQPSSWAIAIFVFFVGFVLWIAYYYARRTKTAKGYFAAGGNIHWAVNGIAFAGDYLSAASFLGICGMIAAFGYDGFLYSIGYLAGWIVALFVVAEPMKRLGKYTFTDALDSKFNSKGIQFTAALSTLVVSIFYLIPQMVGAGVLVKPLFGMPHHVGVILVGAIVIIIVATAGMASTTYVQFLKGGLLIIFSMTVVIAVLSRGLSTNPDAGGEKPYHKFITIPYSIEGETLALDDPSYTVADDWQSSALYGGADAKARFVTLTKDGEEHVWFLNEKAGILEETLTVTALPNGNKLYNGSPQTEGKFFAVGHMKEILINGKPVEKTGNLDPTAYLSAILNGTVIIWPAAKITDGDNKLTVYYPKAVSGADLLRPGQKFNVGKTAAGNINFISLMLALFLGTAALPHILIRYYTVPSPACARKSTIVAIAAIGFFYVLTLFLGLGAMTSGVMDLTDSNMAAPLLAKSFGVILFAIISAIAFATVLGTVSGLIVAASGAVAHDLINRFFNVKLSDKGKVLAGKLAAIGVGLIAMWLGIKYQGMNVSYLVGWAFAVAASANLPAIVMLLFWPKTTSKGIAASVVVGIVSSVGLILLSPEMYKELYALDPKLAPFPIDSPAIISVPLSFLTLVVVSLFTQKKAAVSVEELEAAEERVAPHETYEELEVAAETEHMELLSLEELIAVIQELRAENAQLRQQLAESKAPDLTE
ncbi:MAG: Cation/acetate symporter ActP [bacterium ADurb.Bin429]|nr:MAG: Cation/acetate symporter ActP [bacterium ADurb.Bin429]